MSRKPGQRVMWNQYNHFIAEVQEDISNYRIINWIYPLSGIDIYYNKIEPFIPCQNKDWIELKNQNKTDI